MILINCQEMQYSWVVFENMKELKSHMPIPTTLNMVCVFHNPWANHSVNIAFVFQNTWWDITIRFNDPVKDITKMTDDEWMHLKLKIARVINLYKFKYHTECTLEVKSKCL